MRNACSTNNQRIVVTNIQRFSLHDGPGIRTTIFLKGCSLRCPWCCNPENLRTRPEPYVKDGLHGTYGSFFSAGELVRECLRDRVFYGEPYCVKKINSIEDFNALPGGVTFSGGEALLQMNSLEPVCEILHNKEIHIVVESALFVSSTLLEMALRCIDLFYVDVKILNEERCLKVEKGLLNVFLRNFNRIFSWRDEKGFCKPIVVRVPVIGGLTDDVENRSMVRQLLKKYREQILKIELMKEHDLGVPKYEYLGLRGYYVGVSDSVMETYAEELSELNIPIEICTI